MVTTNNKSLTYQTNSIESDSLENDSMLNLITTFLTTMKNVKDGGSCNQTFSANDALFYLEAGLNVELADAGKKYVEFADEEITKSIIISENGVSCTQMQSVFNDLYNQINALITQYTGVGKTLRFVSINKEYPTSSTLNVTVQFAGEEMTENFGKTGGVPSGAATFGVNDNYDYDITYKCNGTTASSKGCRYRLQQYGIGNYYFKYGWLQTFAINKKITLVNTYLPVNILPNENEDIDPFGSYLNPFVANNHSSTKIFGTEDYTFAYPSTTPQIVCLDYSMMNYYLSKIPDILYNNPKRPAGSVFANYLVSVCNGQGGKGNLTGKLYSFYKGHLYRVTYAKTIVSASNTHIYN